METLSVDRSDPSQVARVAKQNMPKMLRTFDINAQLRNLDDYFKAVISDETNTILLIPQNELKLNDRLLDSASVVNSTAREEVEDSRAKRQARSSQEILITSRRRPGHQVSSDPGDISPDGPSSVVFSLRPQYLPGAVMSPAKSPRTKRVLGTFPKLFAWVKATRLQAGLTQNLLPEAKLSAPGSKLCDRNVKMLSLLS